jgi:hypothetical protein
MITAGFDAIITRNDHHRATAGLSDRASEAVSAFGTVVEPMDSTGG